VGRFARITAGTGAGQILLIAKNTTDTLYFSTIPSPAMAAGSTFVIEDLATVITSPSSLSTAAVNVGRCTGGNVAIQDLAVACGVTSSFMLNSCPSITARRCVARYVVGAFIGFNCSQLGGITQINCGAIGSFTTGFSVQTVAIHASSGFLASGCSTGISLSNADPWFFSSGGSYLRDCSTGLSAANAEAQLIGYVLDTCSQGLSIDQGRVVLQNAIFDNCTSKTMALRMAHLIIRGTLTGTGSVGFGMNAKGAGNVVSLETTPTVSGTLGEVTVDGLTVESWSSLINSGDYILDTSTLAHVSRV
jgi:hypothetical protein